MKTITINRLHLILILFLATQVISAKDFNSNKSNSGLVSEDSIQNQSLFKTKPFLQNPIGGGVTISWFTNVLTHGWIEFGTDKNLAEKAETRIGGQTVANVDHHKIRIEKLNPGTTYYYRAVSREVLKYGAYKKEFGKIEHSEVYSFTLPDSKSENFTALIFNDLHKKEQTLDALMEHVQDMEYDFIIYNGDCIDDPVNERDAIQFISYSNEQVNAAEKPVFYIRGNHEIRGAYSVDLNDIIDYVGGLTFSAFNWGDTRFVFLDCGEDKPDDHWVYYGLNSFEELRNTQLDFLEKERQNKDFKKAAKRVVVHHIPLHGLREKSYAPCTELWTDVLNQSNISLAINGHTHRFAYHEAGSLNNNYPVVIGGGYKENGATVMILAKNGKTMNLKVLSYHGEVLLDKNY